MTEKRAYAVVAGRGNVPIWVDGDTAPLGDLLQAAGFQPGDEVEIRTREEASLDVTCPWCGSTPGVACTGVINDGKAHEARRRSHDRASQSNPEKPSEIRLRVAQGEEQDDSPLLVNEMMGLLADSMEHTMELAMQHGYDLDDVKSFRLLTRVNEMKERLEKNRKRLLGEDCTCSGRARHFPTGIVHIDSCPRSVVGLLRAQAAALAAAPEEQEAPPPFVTGLDFDGNPLVVCENEFHYRDPHKKGRACIRPHPAARQEAPRGWAFDGAHSGGSATHATDTTTPAALPEEVVCDNAPSGPTPHPRNAHCLNPRLAHPPAARTEENHLPTGRCGTIEPEHDGLHFHLPDCDKWDGDPLLAIDAVTDKEPRPCGRCDEPVLVPVGYRSIPLCGRPECEADEAALHRRTALDVCPTCNGSGGTETVCAACKGDGYCGPAATEEIAPGCGTYPQWANRVDTLKRGRDAAMARAQRATKERDAAREKLKEEEGANILNRAALKNALRWRNQIAKALRDLLTAYQGTGEYQADIADNAARVLAQPFTADQPAPVSAAPVEPAPPSPETTFKRQPNGMLTATPPDNAAAFAAPHARSATPEPEKLGEEKTVLRCRVCGGIWSELSLGGWIAVNDRAETCSHLISSFERIPDMRAAPTTKVGED